MKELLVLSADGMKYGVWKADILSIKDAQAVHKIPLSSARIAGMSIIDGRAVTLADFSACIGLAPVSKENIGHILLMSEDKKIAGFVVEGEIEHLMIPSNDVFPMPDYLKTPVIDTCVMHANEPVPVINIPLLYSGVQNAERKPFGAEFSIPGRKHEDALKGVSVFKSGGEFFAVPSEQIKSISQQPSHVSRLALTPDYVKGIAFCDNKLLPVVHLSTAMGLPEKGTGEKMLVIEMAGVSLGLLIDSEHEALSEKQFSLMPLPPVVKTAWMQAAAFTGGNIAPVIYAQPLLSTKQDADLKPLPQQYSPDSQFSSHFGKRDAKVLEFSILGRRQALPASEVEDVLHFKSCHNVPGKHPMIIGVEEHKGELLPVIDIAVCFGKQSLATPEWSMLLVKNGDFRGLVVTDAVFGERVITPDAQRPLPIKLPHNLVYGCYPAEKTVVLILNVEALTVHFDKVQIKKILDTIPLHVEKAQGKVVIPPPKPAYIEAPDNRETEENKKLIIAMSDISGQEKEDEKKEEVILKREPEKEFAPEFNPVEPKATAQLENRQDNNQILESESQPTPEEEAESASVTLPPVELEPEYIPEPLLEPEPRSGPLAPEQFVTAKSESHEPEAEPVESQEKEDPTEVKEVVEITEHVEPKEKEGIGQQQETSDIALKEEIKKTEATILPKPIIEAIMPEIFEKSETPPDKESATQEIIEEPHQPDTPMEVRSEPAALKKFLYKYRGITVTEKWKRGILYAAIPAVIIIALYLSGAWINKDRVVKEQQKPVTAAYRPDEVYIVKRGDTLWAICKRITGNPFNYPAVALENKISDPDIILPGQKIYLKKTKPEQR